MGRFFGPALAAGMTVLLVAVQAPTALAKPPLTEAAQTGSEAIPQSIQARESRFDASLEFTRSRKLAATEVGEFWSVPTSDPTRTCLMLVPTHSEGVVATTCGTASQVGSRGLPLAVNVGSKSVEGVLVVKRVTADLQHAKNTTGFTVADPNLLLARRPLRAAKSSLTGKGYRITGVSNTVTESGSSAVERSTASESTRLAKDIYDPYFHGKTAAGAWHYAPIRKSIVGATASYPIQGNVWVEADKGYSAIGATYVRISFYAMTSGSRCKVERPVSKFYLDCTTVHW